jgi:lipopolysaccharide export system permease protein
MRLLDRYVLRELVVPLSYCLGGFLLFWIAFDLFAELSSFQDKKLLPADIFWYYVMIVPDFLVLVLPIALLLALLYTLTNFSRHNELTAMRAAGIGVWRISIPYFVVGLLLSLTSFALGELWVPQSADAADEILRARLPPKEGGLRRHQVRDLGFTNAREGRIWKIRVYNIQTAEMLHPEVFWAQPDGSRLYIKADNAFHTNETWTFSNVSVYRELSGTNSDLVPDLQTNLLAFPEFSETPEQIRSEIKVSNIMSLRATRRADLPIGEILNYLRLHPKPARSDGHWLFTKLHGRLASPWTCLVVVFMAVPFGMAAGRRNVFVGVAGSLTICFAYFVVQQLGLALGTGGYVVPWFAAWAPNLLFGTLGLILTARVR